MALLGIPNMKAFLWQLLTIKIIGVYDSAIAVILKERFLARIKRYY